MKHAGNQTLDTLEVMLTSIRRFATLKERKRGTFYLKAQAFLHFHEDPAGIFADVRQGGAWKRLPVNSSEERDLLVACIEAELSGRQGASA